MQYKRNNELLLNNFDFLRMLFALTVFFVHSSSLSAEFSLKILLGYLSSHIAVQAFFVISGFLIFMSYENTDKLYDYFSKRLRRIYPAYLAVVVVCAFIGVFFSSYEIQYYFSYAWFSYLVANLIFLNFINPDLPGLFLDNASTAVNGALWTLKIEVMFYLCVPLIVWSLRRLGTWQGLTLFYSLSLLYWGILRVWAAKYGGIFVELQRQLPGQLMFFIAGGTIYYYFEWFKKFILWLLSAAILILVSDNQLLNQIFFAAALAVVVVYFATIFKYLGNFGKYGDFSYGVYIWHFPIIQVLVQCGVFKSSPWFGLGTSFILVLFAAAASWYLIERPFLRRTSHYVEANH